MARKMNSEEENGLSSLPTVTETTPRELLIQHDLRALSVFPVVFVGSLSRKVNGVS